MSKIFDKFKKHFIKFKSYIFSFVIIVIACCLPIIDYIYLYTIDSSNTSNIVTIFTSIFTVLVTFISIIFVYFNFFDNSISEKLANQLHEIEYFAYTFTNVELKKANHTFNPKNNNYPYKEYYECLESCFSKYSDLYNSLESKSKLMYKLYKLCILTSVLAIILLIIDFLIIKIFPILTITLLSIIFSSNLYLIKKVIKRDEDNKNLFPSPDELLTPSTILNEKLCKIYNLEKKLPLKLFHVSTSFLVRNLTEIQDKELLNSLNSKYPYNNKNYLYLKSILPFKIKNIKLFYHYDSFTTSNQNNNNNDTDNNGKPLEDKVILANNNQIELSKNNRIFIPHPIINDYEKKKMILKNKLQKPKTRDDDKILMNSLDDIIILKIFLKQDEQVDFYYRISSIISSSRYLFYAPTYIYENNKHEEIQTTNIYTYNTYNT